MPIVNPRNSITHAHQFHAINSVQSRAASCDNNAIYCVVKSISLGLVLPPELVFSFVDLEQVHSPFDRRPDFLYQPSPFHFFLEAKRRERCKRMTKTYHRSRYHLQLCSPWKTSHSHSALLRSCHSCILLGDNDVSITRL